MFDQLTDVYDAMIDWPKRLAAEGPFYRDWFQQIGAKRVLDTACGTGRHAAMFHSWGLEVEGADLSPAMIQRAQAAFGEPAGLRWTVRAYDQPVAELATWDAVICVGNSLALAPNRETIRQAIAQMIEALRPGGLLLVQVLNLWRLAEGPCLWQKCLRTQVRQAESLILKGVHRSGDRGFVELVVADPRGGPLLAHESPVFFGLETAELVAAARQAGAADVQFFGGYAREPYTRESSIDLVMTAHRSLSIPIHPQSSSGPKAGA